MGSVVTSFSRVAVVIVLGPYSEGSDGVGDDGDGCGGSGVGGGRGVYGGGCGGGGVVVMVVGMVDIRRATKTTINTKTTAPTIPPQSIQIDPFFLIITATLTTDTIITTVPPLPSIPYYHHNHHFNPINTTTAITQTTLNYSTSTTLK